MKAGYRLEAGLVVPAAAEQANILVYADPTAGEKQEVIEALGLNAYELESALDPDEISRVEISPERVSVIWKRPMSASFDREQVRFEVASIGLFLHRERLVMIMGEGNNPFPVREFQGSASLVDALLRFLLHTVHHYLGHLKVIKQITVEFGAEIGGSKDNRYLLQMFALSESLIYYLNAIEANAAVLTKLRANAERLALPKHEIDSLHDLMLDNHQCARQAQIYSTILAELVDAQGMVVNNNVNALLKNLTLINVIFLPLTLIASIGGMSEYTMMTQGVAWPLAYGLLVLGMGMLGLGMWVALVRVLESRVARSSRVARDQAGMRSSIGVSPRKRIPGA